MECLEPRTLLSLVAGTVFNDLDGDGTRDFEPGGFGTPLWTEPGLAGRVVLAEVLYADPPIVYSTTTNDEGGYMFFDLPPQYYMVRQRIEPDWRQTMPPATIAPAWGPMIPGSYIVSIDDYGQYIFGKDFGSKGPGSGRVHGTLWWDLDQDGSRDAGEPGLARRTVFLDLNKNGRLDFPEPVQTTADDGGYSFPGLAAGTYNVMLVGRPGWERTYPRLNGPDNRRLVAMDALGDFYYIHPATGDYGHLYTPNIPNFSYGLAVAPDGNFLTIERPLEPGDDQGDPLDRVQIYRVRPSDGDAASVATLDFGLPWTYDLTYPLYNLEIDPRTGLLYAPERLGYPNLQVIDATNGFAVFDENVVGSGVVFMGMAIDASGKLYGLRDTVYGGGLFITDAGGHTGFRSVTTVDRYFRNAVMEFDSLTGMLNVVGLTEADSGPSWSLYTLNPETGQTTLIGPTGLDDLTGLRFMPAQDFGLGVQTVTVSGANPSPQADFGNYIAPAQIGGTVWKDSNANGTREEDEPGVARWLVDIEASSNALPGLDRRFTSTDATGHFVFPPLEPGEYTIAEAPQAGWRQTSPRFPDQTLDMLEITLRGSLYRMDHLTGDVQRGVVDGGTTGYPEGIALAADGSIYTLTSSDYVYTLFAWNPLSQSFESVGTTGTGGVYFQDLAVNPATGTLYAIGWLPHMFGELFTLDPSTGLATMVGIVEYVAPGSTLERFSFMAFDKEGLLYLLDDDGTSLRLLVIDPETVTTQRTIDLSQRPDEIVAMDIDPTSGVLYLLGEAGYGTAHRGPGEIYTVNLATGEVSLIGSTAEKIQVAGARFRVGRQGTRTLRLSAGDRTDDVDFGNAWANPVVQLPGGRGVNSAIVEAEGSFQGLTIVGAANKSDTLTIGLSAAAPFAIPEGITFDGGSGTKADTLVLRGAAGADTFTLDDSAASLRVGSSESLRVQLAQVERITLDGQAGDDTYRVSRLGANTTIVDSRGTDWLDFSAATLPVSVNLASTSAQRVFAPSNANTVVLKGTFENVIGSPQADTIRGNSAANRIEAGAGNDTVYGNAGNDSLYGGPGNDLLFGDAGDDSLYGGPDNNVLVGGAGNDTLDVLADADASGRNLLIGGLGADTLQGGPGEEILIGGTTTYDAKPAALAAVIAQWASATPFQDRCNVLDAGFRDPIAGFIQLKPKTSSYRRGTVFDDRATDVLLGGLGSNWLLAFPKDDVPAP